MLSTFLSALLTTSCRQTVFINTSGLKLALYPSPYSANINCKVISIHEATHLVIASQSSVSLQPIEYNILGIKDTTHIALTTFIVTLNHSHPSYC